MTLPLSAAMRSVRAAARTAAFFLEVLPTLPSKPVDWVTGVPLVERVRYPTRGGEAEGDLYRPPGAGPHPGVVVCLGVVPFGVDHPQVPRLGAALARAGFAALLWWSPAMRDRRLEPGDAEGIALAYRWLIEQPFVDAGRSGLIGTCVGGSFALLAAADPSIRDRVAFVAAWAPYASMRTLAIDIASATSSREGARTPWPVDQLTRTVFVRSLTNVLAPDEAERLRIAGADRSGHVDDANLSADGQAVYPLLTALDTDAAEAALDRMPVAMRERLDAMSPITCGGHPRSSHPAGPRPRRRGDPDRGIAPPAGRFDWPGGGTLHRVYDVQAPGPDQGAAAAERPCAGARQVLPLRVPDVPAGRRAVTGSSGDRGGPTGWIFAPRPVVDAVPVGRGSASG